MSDDEAPAPQPYAPASLLVDAYYHHVCAEAVAAAAGEVLTEDVDTDESRAFLRRIVGGASKPFADALGRILIGHPDVAAHARAGRRPEEWEASTALSWARLLRDQMWGPDALRAEAPPEVAPTPTPGGGVVR